jgi:FlaA1/EpsC-like NDP-sugar epimerase
MRQIRTWLPIALWAIGSSTICAQTLRGTVKDAISGEPLIGAAVKIAELAKRMIQLSGAKNVQIKYTGLRDGEKLYEEVLNDKEITKPTFNKKIKIASVRAYDYHEVSQSIERLVGDSYHYDEMGTVKEMKEIVPEFKSNHSVYESLDKK